MHLFVYVAFYVFIWEKIKHCLIKVLDKSITKKKNVFRKEDMNLSIFIYIHEYLYVFVYKCIDVLV